MRLNTLASLARRILELLTQRRDQISNGPKNGKQCQQVAGCLRQKFQKECSIDGQIATDTKPNACVQRTRADPVGTTTGSETKGTSEEESKVESQAATENIGCSAPERCANAETQEECEGGVSNFSIADTEFG
jgi:hypothetical protein